MITLIEAVVPALVIVSAVVAWGCLVAASVGDLRVDDVLPVVRVRRGRRAPGGRAWSGWRGVWLGREREKWK